ncbi:hypothetical protein N310_08616, partial [Acanthisitta chloris]
MMFKHENVSLVPYPYICTLYLELNSFQQAVSCGKEGNKDSDALVRKRDHMSESTVVEGTAKRRRVEVRAETSCPQSCVDRTGDECVHQKSKAEHGFDKNSSKENKWEFSSASLTEDCDQGSFWEPMESALEQRTTDNRAEGAMHLLQQMDQTGKKENVE